MPPLPTLSCLEGRRCVFSGRPRPSDGKESGSSLLENNHLILKIAHAILDVLSSKALSEGRSTTPLCFGSVRCDLASFRSATPSCGSTATLQHFQDSSNRLRAAAKLSASRPMPRMPGPYLDLDRCLIPGLKHDAGRLCNLPAPSSNFGD